MTHRVSRIWKAAVFAGQLAMVATVTGGWTNKLNAAKSDSVFAPQLVDDSDYMTRLFEARASGGDSIELDLAELDPEFFVSNCHK